MRKGQHEIFSESVDERESDFVVLVLAVNGIGRKIFECVVHPAHVPFEAEAEAAEIDGARDAWPGGGFFGNSENAGEAAVRYFIHALEEVDGVQIFAAAVAIGHPFAGLARVIEVEHGSDGVNTKAVDVVFVEPEERVRK